MLAGQGALCRSLRWPARTVPGRARRAAPDAVRRKRECAAQRQGLSTMSSSAWLQDRWCCGRGTRNDIHGCCTSRFAPASRGVGLSHGQFRDRSRLRNRGPSVADLRPQLRCQRHRGFDRDQCFRVHAAGVRADQRQVGVGTRGTVGLHLGHRRSRFVDRRLRIRRGLLAAADIAVAGRCRVDHVHRLGGRAVDPTHPTSTARPVHQLVVEQFPARRASPARWSAVG